VGDLNLHHFPPQLKKCAGGAKEFTGLQWDRAGDLQVILMVRQTPRGPRCLILWKTFPEG
jgi:hypothetical protein